MRRDLQAEAKATGLGQIFLRVDTSSVLGTGHVMRCLALAQAWRNHKGNATFVSTFMGGTVKRQLALLGFPVTLVPKGNGGENSPESMLRTLGCENREPFHSSWFCLDGYHFDTTYQRILKDQGFRILVIDDMGHLPFYHADIVLNQNLHGESCRYSCDSSTTLLLGSRYALIREEFLRWKSWKRMIPETARRILVTLGGGDSGFALEKIVGAIMKTGIPDLDVIVVTGPLSGGLVAFPEAKVQKGFRLRVVKSTRNMPRLMAWADLAIAGGGSTSWELAFMGLPSLVVVLAENQIRVAESLRANRIGVNLGWLKDLDEKDIQDALYYLILSPRERREMSRRGRAAIDGHGAERVCKAIAAKDQAGV